MKLKELWDIPGYQFVKTWIKEYDDEKSFYHFLFSMNKTQATAYINNIFNDIHKKTKWIKC